MAFIINFKWIVYIVVFGITIFSLLLGIVDAGVLCSKTNQCKPLADATIGQFLGSQALIQLDVQYIRENPNEDITLIQIHKDRIIRSSFISFFIIWLLWWLIDKGVGVFISKEQKNFGLYAGELFFALILIYLANMLYMGFSYGVWDFIPFGGFFNPINGLFFNLETLITSIGVYTDPFLNQTLDAINNTFGNFTQNVTVV